MSGSRRLRARRTAGTIDVEEKSHPAGGLLADDSGLVFSISPREEQAGRGTRRPDYYPSL